MLAVNDAVNYIQKKIIAHGSERFPTIAVILGSGLGRIANNLSAAISIPYKDIPGFYHPKVEGHSGNMVIGQFNNSSIICLQGRPHFYEGVSHENFKNFIYTIRQLGCHSIIITNAAGSLQKTIKPGDLVLIKDHINLQCSNPLVGPNDDEFGERFVSLENAYDEDYRQQLVNISHHLKITLKEGIYVGVLGPSFETPAEIRAYIKLGADVVGMSTIPEVILARHCGLRVAAISAITNMAVGLSKENITHETTLRNSAITADPLETLILTFIRELEASPNLMTVSYAETIPNNSSD